MFDDDFSEDGFKKFKILFCVLFVSLAVCYFSGKFLLTSFASGHSYNDSFRTCIEQNNKQSSCSKQNKCYWQGLEIIQNNDN